MKSTYIGIAVFFVVVERNETKSATNAIALTFLFEVPAYMCVCDVLYLAPYMIFRKGGKRALHWKCVSIFFSLF